MSISNVSRYLHFVNNTLTPQRQPGKVWPVVINYLSVRFSDLYDSYCKLAVDEAIIKFQGRSSLKQHMPMKPLREA